MECGWTLFTVYLTLSKGQRNAIHFAIPILEHTDVEGSCVLANRGYDSQNPMAISMKMEGSQPSRPEKGQNLSAAVDWRLYKERHLVKNTFSN